MVTDPVLMSIRPPYAEAILAGAKCFELRRRRPSFSSGTQVVIYSSSPLRRLLGTFEVGEVLEGTPEVLWGAVESKAGVDMGTFQKYFAGCSVGYAIEVRNPRRLSPARLRFRPPQSYLFLRDGLRPHRPVLRWAAAG